ncbi:hypothetical protein AB7M47_004832 [Bradyrhizobium elkanii]
MVRQVCWTEHEYEDCNENYNPRMGQRRAVYPRWLKFQRSFVATLGAKEEVNQRADKE